MNYKKPAFWIVIAAVALCIVVAVSFLTNPKDYGPEVGNPKMLEFPGVEWFVTPEELKEALNITEDQIVNEEIVLEREDVGNDYDRYELYVTDLTLYGRDVSYALFQFRRDPGYDFAFEDAIVMFAEDTDIEKLKNDLVEIYGTGSSEPYSYYLYYNNRKKNFNLKLRMEQDLEYRSMHDFFSKELDGNPYQEALEDPAYMTHHWATENGCSFLPEEVVEWFKYAMDQPANADNSVLQDDEVLMEMLDQMPWVAITLSNRCATTIRRDAEGTENESAAYYTNNYLEFSARWLSNYVHAAKETQPEDTTTATDPTENSGLQKSSDLPLLCYPDISWGMSPEQVKEILGVTEDQILLDEPIGDRYILHIKDFTFLGNEVLSGQFNFIVSASGQYHFTDVSLYYPEETDMAAVKDGLTAFYGPPKDGVGFTRYKVTNIGSVEDYTDNGMNTLFFLGDTPVNGWWESEVTLADVLADDIQNKLIKRAVLLNNGDEDFGEATRKYLEMEPAMLLCCTNGYNWPEDTQPYYTKNVVILSALQYVTSIIK